LIILVRIFRCLYYRIFFFCLVSFFNFFADSNFINFVFFMEHWVVHWFFWQFKRIIFAVYKFLLAEHPILMLVTVFQYFVFCFGQNYTVLDYFWFDPMDWIVNTSYLYFIFAFCTLDILGDDDVYIVFELYLGLFFYGCPIFIHSFVWGCYKITNSFRYFLLNFFLLF